MKVTIRDIAKECGVSVSTVSMALSSKPSRVAESTRKRIRQKAEELHYQPNLSAVSLVSRHSNCIGIVINDLHNTHISSLYMAIDEEIERQGFTPICHIFRDTGLSAGVPACMEEKLLNQLESENVAAIIWGKSLNVLQADENKRLEKQLNRWGIPVITMDPYKLSCPGVNVLFDYREGARIAVRNLIANQHRRIGCLAGERGYAVTIDRIRGYRDALEEAGIPYDDSLIYYGDYSLESGYQAFSYLLGMNVTAIFSQNDEMAFGLYRAARNYHIQIPDEISIIGFDDVPFADVMEVPLTTIHIPVQEIGQYIGGEVCRLIMQKDPDYTRKVKIYHPSLRIRRSVKKHT